MNILMDNKDETNFIPPIQLGAQQYNIKITAKKYN